MPLNAARAAGQGAQNTLIETASVLTGIELTSHILAPLCAAREVSVCST